MKILTGEERELYIAERPGTGASDLAKLLEIDPFGGSGYGQFLLKTGRVAAPPPSEAMLAGSAKEEEAMQFSEELLGMKFERQVIAQHDEYPFCYASADGWNAETQTGIEVKCPRSRHTFQYVEDHGTPPPHYLSQVCQQIEIFNPVRWVFVAYFGPDDYIRWEADKEYCRILRGRWQTSYLPVIQRFQAAVESGEWPALSGKAEPEDKQRFRILARNYQSLKYIIEHLESRKEQEGGELRRICTARVVSDGTYKAEWRRFQPTYSVKVDCASAEAAERVMAALNPLSKAAEVKSIKQTFQAESLRFYLTGGNE